MVVIGVLSVGRVVGDGGEDGGLHGGVREHFDRGAARGDLAGLHERVQGYPAPPALLQRTSGLGRPKLAGKIYTTSQINASSLGHCWTL